jgi:hypothetical protein
MKNPKRTAPVPLEQTGQSMLLLNCSGIPPLRGPLTAATCKRARDMTRRPLVDVDPERSAAFDDRRICRRLSGGTLGVIGHNGTPRWSDNSPHDAGSGQFSPCNAYSQ